MELLETTFKKLTVLSKIGGVAFFAIGTDRLVAGDHLFSVIFITMGIGIFFLPFKITLRDVNSRNHND